MDAASSVLRVGSWVALLAAGSWPAARVGPSGVSIRGSTELVSMPIDFADRVRAIMDATLASEEHSSRLVHPNLKASLAALDRREENLLDLVAEGGAPDST